MWFTTYLKTSRVSRGRKSIKSRTVNCAVREHEPISQQRLQVHHPDPLTMSSWNFGLLIPRIVFFVRAGAAVIIVRIPGLLQTFELQVQLANMLQAGIRPTEHATDQDIFGPSDKQSDLVVQGRRSQISECFARET